MKIKISYFYQIRFFKPNQIPISTAIWDPQWYHDFHDQKYIFIDKRKVINGIRLPILNPQTHECVDCKNKDPQNCLFIKHYYEYLSSLDFKQIMQELEEYLKVLVINMGISDDYEVILMVHEAPTNQCSEREVLKKWFLDNQYELEEFHK